MTNSADKFKSMVRSAVCTPVNRLLNYVDPPVLVLLYHRVTSLRSDPEMLAVTPDNFRDQLLYLKENYPIARFEEDWGNTPKPAVAITFDDGYADNALEALPILEELGIPATFFVSTGTIGTGSEFWWHELERIILDSRSLPASFSFEHAQFGRIWPTGTPGERQEFYQGIVRLMNDGTAEQRDNWLAQLRHWAHTGATTADTHRAMTVEELQRLAGSRLVTIGAHTVTHTRLSTLSLEEQQKEITASKDQLEAWLDRNVSVFSYPFGRRGDYTDQSIALCRQAGFIKVAANFHGQSHRWTDPFQIPRHLVRNWPIETFAAKFRGFWTR